MVVGAEVVVGRLGRSEAESHLPSGLEVTVAGAGAVVGVVSEAAEPFPAIISTIITAAVAAEARQTIPMCLDDVCAVFIFRKRCTYRARAFKPPFSGHFKRFSR